MLNEDNEQGFLQANAVLQETEEQQEEVYGAALMVEGVIPTPKAPWNFLHALLFFAVNFVLQIVLAVVLTLIGLDIDLITIINIIFQAILFVLFPVWFVCKRRGLSINLLGFNKAPLLNIFTRGLLGGLIIYLLVIVCNFVVVIIEGAGEGQQILQNLQLAENSVIFVLYIVCITLVAPFAEEVFFRAFLYGSLRNRINPKLAMLIAGVIFGLIHYESGFNILLLLPLMVGGIGFCYLYEKYNNIWINTIAHALWNSTAVLLLLFYSS